MGTFEEAYQKAIKENGCNAGETFARFMFRSGAEWQKQKSIEAYIKTCDFNASGCCGCKNSKGECDCEQLKDFIEELEK